LQEREKTGIASKCSFRAAIAFVHAALPPKITSLRLCLKINYKRKMRVCRLCRKNKNKDSSDTTPFLNLEEMLNILGV
jgi:hypothetical protein